MFIASFSPIAKTTMRTIRKGEKKRKTHEKIIAWAEDKLLTVKNNNREYWVVIEKKCVVLNQNRIQKDLCTMIISFADSYVSM